MGGKPLKNRIGMRYGRLIVLRRAPNKKTDTAWVCRCDCGNITIVHSCNLEQKHTRSCGCLAYESTLNSSKTHGKSGTRMYHAWTNIKQRCENPKNKSYKDYGGRGISVCERWQHFENFYEDMKGGYSAQLEIDRIDNTEGYSKENCRWVKRTVNANNKSNNRVVVFNGESKTLAQWARKLDLNYSTLQSRINCLGWSGNKALSVPTKTGWTKI